MPNNEALECINEITSIITKYNFVFPEPLAKKEARKFVDEENNTDYLKIIKRVQGILNNHKEDNAQMKIKNVIKFLSNYR